MNSRIRLNEALHHLNKIKEFQNNNLDEFEIYLNAFLSSARSVTWILKSECSKSHTLMSKYNSYEFENSENELLSLMTGLRNKSEKEEPIKVSAIRYECNINNIQSTNGEWVKLTPDKIYYTLIEKGDHLDIVSKCERYYNLLNTMVTTFED